MKGGHEFLQGLKGLEITGMRLDPVQFEKQRLFADIVVSIDEFDKSWKLDCIGLKEVSPNLFTPNFVPNYKVKLFQNHPLLWTYNSEMIYLEIVNFFGVDPKLQNSFKDLLYSKSKGWFHYYSVFGAVLRREEKSPNLNACVPLELFDLISGICQVLELKVSIKGQEKNFYPKKSKLLLFNNYFNFKEDLNANQPFLIAEEFFLRE